jgi:hypothetical protein
MVCPMSYPGPRAAYDAVSGYEHLSSRPSRRLGWGSAEYRKRALDGVPCALPCDMRQATFGFSRQGSKAS